MDDTELQSIMEAEIDDAVSFIDSEIGADRAEALNRYFGRPYGDEEEGRSQVVSRDSHDTINAVLPSLMRIFFGPENVVEFVPENEEDVEQAEQATDYVNYVVTNDNDGFGVFYAAIKDALRSKVGFIKYWWDDSVTVTTKTYTGLDEMGLASLMEDLQKAVEAEVVESSQDDNGLTVTIRMKRRADRARIEAIPPEELLISRDARTIDDARLVAHRSTKTISELVAMGYDKDELEAAATGDDLDGNEERVARNPYADGGDVSNDPSMRRLLYIEAYPYVDYDGDGIAELRKVCTIGTGMRVIHNVPWDERCIADLHCDPEPHTFFGQSLSDKTRDVERIKTMVLRSALDSLAQNIFPRTIVVDGDGNIEDAMNTEVGAILRAKSVNGYVPLASQDLSGSALPYLSYMDELRENRTGMSKTSMGLDAEALQNTTATAAEGQFTRSQERIELIARIMATGMRRLFRGILKLLSENQRSQRMVKLRNKWTPVDPRAWRVNMDVVCTMGLGGGSDQQKAQLLALVAQKQELIFQTAGLVNPLVSPKNYHNTLSKILELGGFKNPNAYFTDPESPEGQERDQEEPPPDPKLVEVQERAKLAASEAQFQQKLKEQETANNHELMMRRAELEAATKEMIAAREIDLKERQLVSEIELQERLQFAKLGLQAQNDAADQTREDYRVNAEISDVHVGGDPG